MHTTSNSVSSPDLNKQTQQRRRRRNRTRNRKKQTSHQKQQDGNKQKQQQQQRLDLSDLTSEASALERQLNELQTQLKLTYANTPKKASGDAAIAEQIAATEDEMEYVRKSLKDAYRQILDKDLLFAISQRIDDKMWRHVFYANIEQVRSKLRKLRPENDHATRHRLLKAFFRHFDATFKFYRDLNNRIKHDYHVDTRTLGIDLFKQGSNQKNGRSATDEKIGQLIQSNYICMGDVARYRASQAMADNKKKIANDYWKLSKECYQKAVDVYRASGKPYSQLALVSLSNGSAIDVVFYYCMSLAMKYPSSVGRDNLRSFYSKLRFPSTKSPKEKTGTSGMIAAFVESFLQVHKDMLFGDSVDAASYTGFSGKLGQAIYNLMLASQSVDSDALSSSLLVVKTTLTRTVCILMISAWDFGERMKSKENLSQWTQLQSRQIHVLTFAFKVISALYQNIQKAQEELKDQFEAYRYEHMCDMVDKAILPGVSMWCTFLAYNLPLLAQYCAGANAEGRNIRDNDKRELVKALQAFLVCLIGHSMFPDPIANILPATYPVSEDLTLLGLMPLAKFHVTVDFFKENTYENIDEKSDAARAQIRWARVREFTKKVSESSSFEFVQYNKAEQKYSVIDENAKRQQQNRFMKALATQRLMEQVSSLEKNVNRLNLGGSQEPAEKPNICKVIVDVTAFLDSLSKLKKWSNQTLNVGSRQQSMILEVIVPLETIDSLDVHKKGNSHLNMQARESIRFLDQTLKKDSGERSLTTSFLRTQKLSEKLSEWSEAEKYWLGEGRGKNGVVVAADNVSEQSSEDEDEDGEDGLIDVLDNSDIESVSSEDLFKSRRRQFDEEEEEEEDEEDQESGTSISDTEGSEEESEESEGEDDQDEPLVSFKDVPRTYAPIINCMLYYMTHQDPETRRQNLLQLVLVTNDENLAYWAEMFGDPNTGKRLCVKTTEEWDHLVRTGRLLEDS